MGKELDTSTDFLGIGWCGDVEVDHWCARGASWTLSLRRLQRVEAVTWIGLSGDVEEPWAESMSIGVFEDTGSCVVCCHALSGISGRGLTLWDGGGSFCVEAQSQ